MSAIPTGAEPDWRLPPDAKAVVSPGAQVYEWIPQDDVSVRPEHAGGLRWRTPPVRFSPEQIKAEQRAAWAAKVRSMQLLKRAKRAQRTTAPDWRHNMRCFVLELQRDRAAVLLTSGCRCPACRTDVRSVVDIDGWPDFNLTRGPRRLTRAQRKLTRKAQL